MKTTIELPDELASQARDFARDQGTTLRELVVEGLRGELIRRETAPRVDWVFPSYHGGGGLQRGVDPADMIEISYGDRT